VTAPPNTPSPLRYADSGVSIDAGNELAARIKRIAARTHGAQVLGGIGGFGALYELPGGYRRPVLVSAADGVGTKLKLATGLNRHDHIGVDLVAMCANDLVCCAAAPLFFLDYFAAGELQVEQAATVVDGIARGCELAACALVGGESAEMPGVYARGDYDLAGFAVGIVERDAILDASQVAPGDVVLGLASAGAHANGFSLIRKVLELSGADLSAPPEWGDGDATLGEILLTPTRIYVRPLLKLLATVKVTAIAHITGGGIVENLPRVLPAGAVAQLHRAAWPVPRLFEWLRSAGNIDDAEMLRTFNCGIGMVVTVAAGDAARAVTMLESAGETVARLGQITAADGRTRVEFVDG